MMARRAMVLAAWVVFLVSCVCGHEGGPVADESPESWRLHLEQRRRVLGQSSPVRCDDKTYQKPCKMRGHRWVPSSPLSRSATRMMHGMIIDAGSGGSRLHVYEWEPRHFHAVPPPLSVPGTYSRWTKRYMPGIATLAGDAGRLAKQLDPLLKFARRVLAGQEHRFHTFPIFLKATAGMRLLPNKDRETLVEAIRHYFRDPAKNPFAFETEYARVISGEEEGIYGWVATNFLLGALFKPNEGSGPAEPKQAFGAMDLGGASTQISFFREQQDILANMMKLQIGGQRHWNVYTHSHLGFGEDVARSRMHARMVSGSDNGQLASSNATATAAAAQSSLNHGVPNPCMPDGYSSKFYRPPSGWGDVARLGAARGPWTLHGTGGSGADKLERCIAAYVPVLRKADNVYCDAIHHGQCSFGGVYQPPLPRSRAFGNFFAFGGGYDNLWPFLDLNPTSTLLELRSALARICGMTYHELVAYSEEQRGGGKKADRQGEDLSYLNFTVNYCSLGSYVLTLLEHGYGFEPHDAITNVWTINGTKLGWALGAMLYEINALPYTFSPDPTVAEMDRAAALPWKVALVCALVISTVLALLAAVLAALLQRARVQRGRYAKLDAEAGGRNQQLELPTRK